MLQNRCSSRVLAALGAIAVSASASCAWACSGPGAPEAIRQAERLGWTLWGATLLMLSGAVLVPRLRSHGWLLLLLAVVHPGWWMSARSGDCGRTLIGSSVLVTVLTPVAICILLLRSRAATQGSP